MNTFKMNIDKIYLDNILSGDKVHEYRLANEKRMKVQVGDLIHLTLKNMTNYALVKVKDIHVYPSWEKALLSTSNYLNDFKGSCNSLEEVLDKVKVFYSEDEVKKYGIIVFDIELIK